MAGRARVVAIRACRVPSCKANLIIFCCACELTDASIASDTHNLPQTADFWWGKNNDGTALVALTTCPKPFLVGCIYYAPLGFRGFDTELHHSLLWNAQSALCRRRRRSGRSRPGWMESIKSIVTLPKPLSARIFEPLKSSALRLSHSSRLGRTPLRRPPSA